MPESQSIKTSGSPALKVNFQREGDRWANEWLLDQGTEKLLLVATSIDGDSQQAWPSSPPLQEVDLHELENGVAILAVGMAGKSHWSAAFSIDQNLVLAELACLVKNTADSEPGFIGSTYQIAEGLDCKLLDDGVLEIKTPTAIVVIQPVSGDGWSSKINLGDHWFCVVPVENASNPNQSTRWSFRIEVKS